jgi:hypothetical protein
MDTAEYVDSNCTLRLRCSPPVLVNAASKGHLPVVLYLLSKQRADPLIRNNWGETAFDIAAAIFEAWICEVKHFTSNPVPCSTLAGAREIRTRKMEQQLF